jgi:hypothetical protein
MGYTTTFSCPDPEQIDFHSKSALQKASLKSCALQTALGILIKVRRQRLQINSAPLMRLSETKERIPDTSHPSAK